jgi:hypothetical protein
MRLIHDPDEFEAVTESRPCTSCGGDPSKCNGGCNGMASFGLKRRSPEEVARIKAERRKQEENEILAQADAIRARRG